MFDIRDHGGNFGDGKYKKNSVIKSWNLNPFIPDISKLGQISAASHNDYRPTISYDKVTKRHFLGCGTVHVRNNNGSFFGSTGTGLATVSDIKVVGEKVFLRFSNNLMVTDTSLTTNYQTGISLVNGIVPMADSKVYAYGNTVKGVYVYDPLKPLATFTHDAIILLKGVLGNPESFTRDEQYFYLVNTIGQLQKFDLTGALISTIQISTASIGEVTINGEFLYYCDKVKTIYKKKIDSGDLVWFYTKTDPGNFSVKLDFDEKYVYCPSSGATNMTVLDKATGSVIFLGSVNKGIASSGSTTDISDIEIFDGTSRITTMAGSVGSSYYFEVLEWVLDFKIKE